MKKVMVLANHIDWVYSLRKELIEKLSEVYKVIVCIPECKNNHKLNYFKSIGVEFIFIDYQRRSKNLFKDLILFKKYCNAIRKLNPDIVLTYTIKPNLYGTFAASRYRKPVIINITGLGTAFTNPKLKLIVNVLYKLACKSAHFVFFQNESNHSLFISNKLVKPNKTKTIPGSGVNIDKFKPIKKQNHDGILRFLFIGRIMKEKGIEEYLEVAEILTKKYPKIEFQILGSFEEEKYKDIILNNKNPKIKYLGISNDVRNEIKDVDCIVNPSYHEGMSNVLLEGAAMGKPLIASNIPGCKEIVENGYNGYLFRSKSVLSLKDKLIKFIELDSKEKDLMGKNSREKVVTQFDRNIVVNEYLKIIEKAIGRGL